MTITFQTNDYYSEYFIPSKTVRFSHLINENYCKSRTTTEIDGVNYHIDTFSPNFLCIPSRHDETEARSVAQPRAEKFYPLFSQECGTSPLIKPYTSAPLIYQFKQGMKIDLRDYPVQCNDLFVVKNIEWIPSGDYFIPVGQTEAHFKGHDLVLIFRYTNATFNPNDPNIHYPSCDDFIFHALIDPADVAPCLGCASYAIPAELS